ncbi:MAG: transposase [Candidatus Calescibacterium sp.]|nr:transposase [Candidatus Calescibacterium sp.]
MNYISNKHIELLSKLIKKLIEQFYSQNPPPKRPGRPPAYTTEIIILAAILKIHKNVSYRTLELILKDRLGHSPDFSTIFYRFKKLNPELLSFVLSKTAEICEKVLDIKEYHAVVADATGFGYDDTVKLNYLRGKQIRQVKAHVKTEALIGVRGKKKIVLGVAVGEAYSDELKLLWSMLDRAEFKAQHFVADGYYDSVRLIKHFEQRQIKCVTPISERMRQEVRNRYRKLVKERYEDERY